MRSLRFGSLVVAIFLSWVVVVVVVLESLEAKLGRRREVVSI